MSQRFFLYPIIILMDTPAVGSAYLVIDTERKLPADRNLQGENIQPDMRRLR